ncbi:MAG: hypothetical protein ACRET5_19115 [Steroidobacteraceae bacterium]
MTGSNPSSSHLAAFRGPVACRRTADALTLTGAAADSLDDRLIVTLSRANAPEMPNSFAAATVSVLDEHRYRITSASRFWAVEAASAHVHRDVGAAFYRAIPPRAVPLRKRLFWRVVLALAGTRSGKRMLLSLRRQR